MNGKQAGTQPAEQWLTFALAEEAYAVGILSVREIRGWSGVSRIPQAPAHMLGVVNLRGTFVPVMDLRARFGLAAAALGDNTVIIVLNVAEHLLGVVVDGVSDVIDIDVAGVKPVPNMGATVDTRYLKGLVTHGEQMVMLLDVEQLVRPQDLELLGAAAAQAGAERVAA
jgi:purine-binding chemotaxis protein CheW